MLGLYLCGSFGNGEMTFYQGIKRLQGGCSLIVSREGLVTKRFWDPDPNDVIRLPSDQDYVERFRELLFEAVQCRLRSNAPVEIKLSGGVDSATVASVAGHLRQKGMVDCTSLSALTCVYQDPPLDETPYVRLVAEQCDLLVTWLSIDDCWVMKPVAYETVADEPFRLHFEAMHQATLLSAQARGIRVVLTGEGGDEMSLPGYMLHHKDWFRRLRWWSILHDLQDATPEYRRAALAALRHSTVPRWLRQVIRRSSGAIPPWIRPEFARRHDLASLLRNLQPRTRFSGMYLQQRGRGPLFLGGEVRSAMFGIEVRHPLWDSRIVEFLARIPPHIRFAGGRNKVLLRQAMSGVVPEGVRGRAPHGAFEGLVRRGLREMETGRMRDLIHNSHLADLGALDTSALEGEFSAYLQSNEIGFGRGFWSLITEDWLRQARPQPQEAGDLSGSGEPLAARTAVS